MEARQARQTSDELANGAHGYLMSGSYQKPRCNCCGKLAQLKGICWFKDITCKYCMLVGHTHAVCRDEDAKEHYHELHADTATSSTTPKGGGNGKHGNGKDVNNGKTGGGGDPKAERKTTSRRNGSHRNSKKLSTPRK